MREIKFRAWSNFDEMMSYDVTLYANGWTRVVWPNGYEAKYIPDSGLDVMQYAGLKDKNGIEIYEGDIVHTLDGLGKVIFEEKLGSFAIEYSISKIAMPHYLAQSNAKLEVIGNIYENPDLLEGDN